MNTFGHGSSKGKGKRKGKPSGKRHHDKDAGPKTFQSKPSRKDRIDPDNPFAAALMGLRDMLNLSS